MLQKVAWLIVSLVRFNLGAVTCPQFYQIHFTTTSKSSLHYFLISLLCTTKNSKEHITIIDSLRGLAVLGVCLFHFISENSKLDNLQFLQDSFSFGSKGVQLFFVISSIVVPLVLINANYSIRSFFRYLLRRLTRLEPVYLASIIFSIVLTVSIALANSTEPELNLSLNNLLLHFAYLIPFTAEGEWINPVYWSLAIEFQYYIVLGLCFPLALSKKVALRAIFYMLFLVGPLLLPSPEHFPFWAPYFLLGVIYVLRIKNETTFQETVVVLALAGVLVLKHQDLIDFLIAGGAIGMIHFFRNKKLGLLHNLGLISYSVYLFHTLFGTKIQSMFLARFNGYGAQFLSIFVALFATVLLAYVMYRLVEKPSKNLSKKVKYN